MINLGRGSRKRNCLSRGEQQKQQRRKRRTSYTTSRWVKTWMILLVVALAHDHSHCLSDSNNQERCLTSTPNSTQKNDYTRQLYKPCTTERSIIKCSLSCTKTVSLIPAINPRERSPTGCWIVCREGCGSNICAFPPHK